jgi:ferredoxin
MEKIVNDVITLRDSKSFLRKNLFRLFAINSIDGMEFYYFMGEMAQRPIVGKAAKMLMTSYYKHVHTNAVKLPLKDIEDVINNCDHVSVGPCPCRVIFDKNDCTAPIYTCLKINYFSKFTSAMQKFANKLNEERGLQVGNKKSKDLSKEEAIELMRNARKHDLIFSLESCIKPYQNNICACCPDCCIEMNMRYKFGLDVCPGGPYIPSFNQENCVKCGECASRCPIKAISLMDGLPSVDLKQCLGCGICSEICPASSVSMILEQTRMIKTKEPGPIKISMIFFLSLLMFLLFCGYKASKKSDNIKYFLAEPRDSDLIQ